MDWGIQYSIEGAAKYWREDILVQRRISPEITDKYGDCLETEYPIFFGSP